MVFANVNGPYVKTKPTCILTKECTHCTPRSIKNKQGMMHFPVSWLISIASILVKLYDSHSESKPSIDFEKLHLAMTMTKFVCSFSLFHICTNLYLFIYYCRNFVPRLSQKPLTIIRFKFSQYLCLIPRNRVPPLFSLITQPWRHLGAILWIHVIIHIFITIHSKSTIFNAHKLQAICQHIGLFISGLYQIRARARASKFRNAQNHL